jgi:hypothetical protein
MRSWLWYPRSLIISAWITIPLEVLNIWLFRTTWLAWLLVAVIGTGGGCAAYLLQQRFWPVLTKDPS